MNQKLKLFFGNNLLIKIASLNTVSVIIKIFTGLITSKLIALFIGPPGLALIGNLRDFIKTIQSFATFGFSNGIVKYVSEFKTNTTELGKTISTVFYTMFIAATLIALVCFFGADYFNDLIFTPNKDYAYIIRILALALPFYALKMLMFAMLNGLSRYKHLLAINIIAQLVTVLINGLLIWKYHLKGALVFIVVVEIFLFFIALLSISQIWKYFKLISFKNISFNHLKNLSSFSIMALFSATVLPLTAVLIRNYIIDTIGEDEAGFWSAMTRISTYYIMFISTLTSLYILPRFAEINTSKAFRKEVFDFYRTIIPIFAFGLIVIYFLRSFIVTLIFSKTFVPVENLFLWQLLGDFVKVLSLVISYQFLAKNMFWHYLIVEAFFVIVLYSTSIYFIDVFGVKGATIAHFVTFTLNYVLVLLIFRKSLFGELPQK